jgi:hypothetical protein
VSRCSLPIEMVLERRLFHILLGGSMVTDSINKSLRRNSESTGPYEPLESTYFGTDELPKGPLTDIKIIYRKDLIVRYKPY